MSVPFEEVGTTSPSSVAQEPVNKVRLRGWVPSRQSVGGGAIPFQKPAWSFNKNVNI